MNVTAWILWQLLSYGLVSWLVFLAIAFCAARFGGWKLVPVGHVVLAVIIVSLDVRWIQGEMRKPGWAGTPDMDIVFHIGVLLRILLINTVLLPVTAFAIWCRKKARRVSRQLVNDEVRR